MNQNKMALNPERYQKRESSEIVEVILKFETKSLIFRILFFDDSAKHNTNNTCFFLI